MKGWDTESIGPNEFCWSRPASYSLSQPCKLGVIPPIAQMRRARLSGAPAKFCQGHRAPKYHSKC